MSFVIADAQVVNVAAGQLAGLRTALGDAAAAVAGPTTGIAAAAGDEISVAIAQLFGNFGQDFQAVNTQAATFHAEFVKLLNGGASAYVEAEIANAERALLGGVATAAPGDPFGGLLGPLGPILGGGGTTGGGLGGLLGGSGGLLDPILFGGNGGLLGPLIGGNGVFTSLLGNSPLAPFLGAGGQQIGTAVSAFLNGTGSQYLTSQFQGLGSQLFPGLFPPTGGTPTTTTLQPGGAWPRFFLNTANNLAALNNAFASDSFPLLRQIVANQQGYAYLTGQDLALFAQDPAAFMEGWTRSLATVSPASVIGRVGSGFIGNIETLNTSVAAFNRDLSANLVNFPSDWALVNQDIATGQYNQAVADGTTAVLNLFLTTFDTSSLSDIRLVGPAGDLFPILSLPSENLRGAASLMVPSIGSRMTDNLGRFVTALADTSVSASFGFNLAPNLIDSSLALNASFGLPLSLVFGIAGAPVAALDGFATAGSVIGGGIVTGNPVQILGGFADAPAYVLDGLLNGEVLLDVPLPVTVTPNLIVDLTGGSPLGELLGAVLNPIFPILGPINIPVVAHLPFNGLLVPPQAIQATVPIEVLGLEAPVTLTLGGTKFGGLFQLLANTGFRTLADSIAN